MPWIIAGKRADPIQGSNVFLAACQRPTPPQGQRDGRFTLEPWENASGTCLENTCHQHSFQDANYHDQIVKERNKPTPQHRSAARPARDLSWTEVHSGPRSAQAIQLPKRASTHGESHEPSGGNRSPANKDRPQDSWKLTDPRRVVKHLKKNWQKASETMPVAFKPNGGRHDNGVLLRGHRKRRQR